MAHGMRADYSRQEKIEAGLMMENKTAVEVLSFKKLNEVLQQLNPKPKLLLLLGCNTIGGSDISWHADNVILCSKEPSDADLNKFSSYFYKAYSEDNDIETAFSKCKHLASVHLFASGSLVCHSCNAKLNSEEAKFCSQCGKPVNKQSVKLNCATCGATIDEASKFCSKCGSKV